MAIPIQVILHHIKNQGLLIHRVIHLVQDIHTQSTVQLIHHSNIIILIQDNSHVMNKHIVTILTRHLALDIPATANIPTLNQQDIMMLQYRSGERRKTLFKKTIRVKIKIKLLKTRQTQVLTIHLGGPNEQYQTNSSPLMTQVGTDNLTFWVLDIWLWTWSRIQKCFWVFPSPNILENSTNTCR